MAGSNKPAVPDQPSALKALFKSAIKAEENTDPEAVAVAMVERIMGAGSVDDILGGTGEVTHAEDLIGIDLMLTGLSSFNESDYAEGAGVYAVVTGHTFKDPDDELTITCGSSTVCAQIWRLNELNVWPVAAKFEKSTKPTRSGYYPIQLRKVNTKKYEAFASE